MHLDYLKRELNCRILYCGPEVSGKTSSLNAIRHGTPARLRGGETIVTSALEPGLRSEYLQLHLGKTGGLSAQLHIYTLPARSSFDLAPKTLLRLLDGIVLVLDGRTDRVAANLAYIESLRELLAEQGLDLEEIPLVFQWGMLDLPGAGEVEDLNALYNPCHLPAFSASPPSRRNVAAPLRAITRLVLATSTSADFDFLARAQKPARADQAGSLGHGSGNGGSETRAAAPTSGTRFEVHGCKKASRLSWLGIGRRSLRIPAPPAGEERREQRSDTRIDTQRLVSLSGAAGGSTAGSCLGRTVNLSQGGMLVELFGPYRPEGSVLDIQLALEDQLVDAQARPVRMKGGLVALQFHDLSVEAYLTVRRTLARATMRSKPEAGTYAS